MADVPRDGDSSAGSLQRYRSTRTRIALRMLNWEGRPLLVAVLPVALIAAWSSQRIAYHPPRAGEPIEVIAHFTPSVAEQIVHIVPDDGVTADSGWVQEVRPSAAGEGQPATASWTLRWARPTPYVLQIRHKSRTYALRLLVGQRTYEAPFTFYRDGLLCAEVGMRQVRLLNLVPGIPAIGLPAWLVGYLLLAVPSVTVLRRLLRVY